MDDREDDGQFEIDSTMAAALLTGGDPAAGAVAVLQDLVIRVHYTHENWGSSTTLAGETAEGVVATVSITPPGQPEMRALTFQMKELYPHPHFSGVHVVHKEITPLAAAGPGLYRIRLAGACFRLAYPSGGHGLVYAGIKLIVDENEWHPAVDVSFPPPDFGVRQFESSWYVSYQP